MDVELISYLWPVSAFIVVAVFILPMKYAAPYFGLMDQPGGRKQHDGATPLIGGLVLFPVFIAVSVIQGDTLSTHWPLYGALLLLLITGVVDDKLHLHSFIKFAMQFLAAFLIVVPGGAIIHQLGDLFGFGDVGLDVIAIPFSIVSVVLLINAINLMDGLDGLAGGAAFVILGWMLFAGADSNFGPSLTILMAAVAGFLVHNMRSPIRKKASIFMGDAGSMCLGLMVGWYAIKLSPEGARYIEPMAVAWVLALPIWDECAQFYRRVCEGRHPFSPDRGHFHHHFIRADIPAGKAVVMILGLVFLTGAIGVLGVQAGIPLAVLTLVWIAGILGHMVFSKNLARYTRLLQILKRG